jgi:predicted metalloprotease with PDZ domain
MLIWLEVDAKLRQMSGGRRSLDDFARDFFGRNDGDQGISTYNFDDLVRTLNAIVPFDWASYLRERVDNVQSHAPLAWIQQGGYRLTYSDTAPAYFTSREKDRKILDLTYTIGVVIGEGGAISGVSWDSPLFNEGVTSGTTIVAVNGRQYSNDLLRRAITAAKGAREPIRLLTRKGDTYREVTLDYHDGLRYPVLERVGTGPSSLDALLAPLQ